MNPSLGELFGASWLSSYGLFAVLGLGIGSLVAFRGGLRVGFERRLMVDLLGWVVVAAILGSKLMALPQVIGGWRPSAQGRLIDEAVRFGAALLWSDAVFLGGVMGGAVALFLFARRHRVRAGRLFDAVAPGLFLGHVWGRLGCFLVGCCFGKAGGGALGVRFGPGSRAWESHSALGITSPREALTHDLHPAQLYEALLQLGIAAGLLFWLLPRRRWAGQATILSLCCYAAGRFLIEVYRGDAQRGFLGDAVAIVSVNRLLGVDGGSPTVLSLSQLLVILLAMICAWTWLFSMMRKGGRRASPGRGVSDGDEKPESL